MTTIDEMSGDACDDASGTPDSEPPQRGASRAVKPGIEPDGELGIEPAVDLGNALGSALGSVLGAVLACAAVGGDELRDRAASLGDDDVFEALAELESDQRRRDAVRLALLAELDARDLPWRTHGLRTAGWLAHAHQWPRNEAHRQVRTARTCRRSLGDVADAVRDGRLTIHHAEFLTRLATPRVAAVVQSCQQVLIDLARDTAFDQWATDVRMLVRLADADGGHTPGPESDRASISIGLEDDTQLVATLHGANGHAVRAALEAECSRRLRHHRHLVRLDPSHQMPSRSQLLAESLCELVRRGVSAGPGARPPVTDVTLVVHAGDPATSSAQFVDATTTDGVALADGTVRQLLCDSVLHPVVVDSLGVPLDHGTAVRFATPEQRRAALVRDGGCVHPGCDAPHSWVQLHHVVEARLGGATDLRNLASVCPTHHGLWHSRGWHVEPTADGRFEIITPAGRRLRSQRHGRPAPVPVPVLVRRSRE